MSAIQPIAASEQDLARRQQELREIIGEMFWGSAVHSNIGRNYIELRDDCGLEYAVRNVVARARIMRDVMAMLKKSQPAEIPDGS
jgi:hypothetical protein